MAIAFVPPRFRYDYNLNTEKKNFDDFFTNTDRAIPHKRVNEIDLATWNIANLGLQKRRDIDLKLIAYILSKFDIIAIQEVNARLEHFLGIMDILKPHDFDTIFTDPAGNEERLAVVYKTTRIRPRCLFGELDYNPAGKVVKDKYILKPKTLKFSVNRKKYKLEFYNFNRNPFLSTWEVIGRNYKFMLANVHIYWGEESTKSPEFKQRIAEVFYLANWARERLKPENRGKLYESNIILLGDMNIPTLESTDPNYRALMRRGMRPSRYATQVGTTIQEFTKYDQIVFTNAKAKITLIKNRAGVVVDFDNFIFRDLWNQKKRGQRTLEDFKAWTKFAISDHRPLFVRLKV